ncbi:zinc finger, CCHC-type containing protein [Tanacetum coccineum]
MEKDDGDKFDIEKFDGKNDFGLCQVRIKALLEQHGLAAAFEELPATTIVAYDNVIRGDLEKVRDFIHEKSLANHLYLKKKLYTFHMHPGKNLSEHIDEFHKLVDFAIWSGYFKLEDVLATFNSRELQKMTEAKGDGGEGLYVRGRSGQRNMEQGTDSAWSKLQERSNRLKCYICQSEEHLKRDCPSVKELLDWIMDSGGSYHITYMRDYLVDFEKYNGGNILLGDGRECRDKGWSGKIKVIKGLLMVLSGTRRSNCVYTLDGQAVTSKTLKGRKLLGEYQTGWKIKTGNVLDSCNQRSTQQCTKSRVAKHLGVAGIQHHNGLVEETNVTLLAKTPIDMLGFFGWLASIKQGMLEPVKVKCIFLGYRKDIMGNKALEVR